MTAIAAADDDRSPDSPFADRSHLCDCIVKEIRHLGHFIGHVPGSEPQSIVDVRWAAMKAGQVLDIPTSTYVSEEGWRFPGMVTVMVITVEPD